MARRGAGAVVASAAVDAHSAETAGAVGDVGEASAGAAKKRSSSSAHGTIAFGEGQAKRARLGGTEESAKAGDKSFGKHHVLWGEINDECPSR